MRRVHVYLFVCVRYTDITWLVDIFILVNPTVPKREKKSNPFFLLASKHCSKIKQRIISAFSFFVMATRYVTKDPINLSSHKINFRRDKTHTTTSTWTKGEQWTCLSLKCVLYFKKINRNALWCNCCVI